MASLILLNSYSRLSCALRRVAAKRQHEDFVPSIGQVRWSKPWIRKYKQPTFDKKLILGSAEPIKEIDRRVQWEKCTLAAREFPPPHPWEEIMAKDFREQLTSSRFVAVYHKNAIPAEEERLIRNMLFKKSFLLKQYNRTVYKLGLAGTKFEALSHLFTAAANTCVVSCPEPKVGELLKLDKKMHGFVLLYGLVEGQTLRKDELVAYSALPSLDILRAQLCGTLESVARSVSDNINHHVVSLSHNLEALSQQQQSKGQEDDLTRDQTKKEPTD